MLEYIVHRHDIWTRQRPRQPEKVWNVHQIDIQPFQYGAEFKISLCSCVRFEEGNDMKVRRERANLLDFFGRPDEKVFGSAIQPAQGSHNIPGVRADAKLGHSANIEGDLHGMI